MLSSLFLGLQYTVFATVSDCTCWAAMTCTCEARSPAAEKKPLMRSLPLDPGIEACFRHSLWLVTGYAESKVAHEQALAGPDASDAYVQSGHCKQPAKATTIAAAAAQQRQLSPSGLVARHGKLCLYKMARLNDSIPHRLSNSTVASHAVHKAGTSSDPLPHKKLDENGVQDSF